MCVCVFVSRNNNNKQNRFVKYTTHGILEKNCVVVVRRSLAHSLPRRVVKRYTWKRKKSSSCLAFRLNRKLCIFMHKQKMHRCNAMLWVFRLSRTHTHSVLRTRSWRREWLCVLSSMACYIICEVMQNAVKKKIEKNRQSALTEWLTIT